MSNYWKAYALVKRKQVQITLVKPEEVIVFNVKNTEVIYDIKADYWLCLCEYSSLWKGSKDNYCYHVKACRTVLYNLFEDHKVMEKWLGRTVIS